MVARIFVLVLGGLVFVGFFLEPIVVFVKSIDIDTANFVDGFLRVALPVAIIPGVLLWVALRARRHQSRALRSVQPGDD